MKTTRLFALTAAVGSIWLLSSCTTTQSLPLTTAGTAARVTVLYDAFGKDAAMTKDWGYAALVEINGKRILFDTGDDPAIFAKNVKAKGVDLTKLDFVVLSHRHGDHTSGVSYLLSANPKVKIYAPAEDRFRERTKYLAHSSGALVLAAPALVVCRLFHLRRLHHCG